jgi:protein phosphatase
MAMHVSSRFETGSATHPGKLRTENEDAFLDNAPIGLWAVADGMGGHDAGQLASTTLIEALGTISPTNSAAELLVQCEARIVETNSHLLRIAAERRTTIGTTLALLLAYGVNYACIWSGDSRIYRIRDGAIARLSRDHTEVQDLVDQGLLTAEEGRVWPRRNVITRAIGVGTEPELEIQQGVLVPDDTFVLCSDGLTTHVHDDEILQHVAYVLPQGASDALVALALDRGGTDNVTVVVVHHAEAPC